VRRKTVDSKNFGKPRTGRMKGQKKHRRYTPAGVVNLVCPLAFVPFMLCIGVDVRLAHHEGKMERARVRGEKAV